MIKNLFHVKQITPFSVLKISLLLFVTLSLNPISARTYYVSPNGKNHFKGTYSKPFQTIQFALDKLKEGDKCYIRKGTYYENICFKHSGTAKKPIIVSNYKNEKVIIKPHRITTKWQHYKGSIYRTRMNDSVIQLFSKEKSLMQASFPSIEEGYMNTSHWLTIEAFANKEIRMDTNANIDLSNSYFIGLSQFALIAMNGEVVSQKENRVIIQNEGFYWDSKFQRGYFGVGKGFFVGKLTFLDRPGEWFSDGKFLYYYPKNKHPKNDHLTYRTTKNTIVLDNRTHIHLSGIKLMGGCLSLVNSRYCLLNSIEVTYPVSFFKFHSGFTRQSPNQNNDINYFEGKGIEISGNHNTLQQCKISKSWGDGITINGSYNTLKECTVEDCDWMGIDCSPLVVDGSNHLIQSCDFSKTGRSVVMHRAIKNSKILYNKIHNGGLLCDDLGLTYCYDSNGENTEIAYNWIYENHAPIYGSGIYLDNYSSNYKIHNNVVWDCFLGMTINQPCKNIIVDHNTFWKNKYTMSSFHPVKWKADMKNVVCSNNLTDSKLTAILYFPFIGSTKKDNMIVDDLYSVLKNPKEFDFRPIDSKKFKVGAYLNQANWSAGVIHQTPSESIFFPNLLLAFYIIIIALIFRKAAFFRILSFQTSSTLFLLKFGFALTIMFVYTYYYPNRNTAEIFKHFDDSKQVFQSLFHHHTSDYFKFIFNLQDNKPAINNMLLSLDHLKQSSDGFMIRIHCFIHLFSAGYYPIHALFFSLFSFLGSFFLFKVLFNFFGENKREIIIGLFCLPSFLFWTSGTIEDSILVFFFGVMCYGLLHLSQRKKMIMNGLGILLATLIMYVFRPYLVLAFLPVISYLFLSIFFKKHSFLSILSLNICCIIGLFSLHHFIPSIHFLSELSYVQQDLLNVASEMHAHSTLTVYTLNGTEISFVNAIPRALWNVFIEPIPTTTSIFILLTFLENTGLIVLLIVALFKFRYLSQKQKTIIFLIGFFCLFISLFIGWTIPIAGLISRYKAIFLPLLFTLFLVIIQQKKQIQ